MSPSPEPFTGRPPRFMRRTAALVFLTAACTTQQVEPPPATGEMASMAPALSVERFLQAVNARDYQAMVGLFGTAQGPIQGERRELEVRMDLMAQVLRHQDYRIGSQRSVSGRVSPTTRIGVDLTIGGNLYRDVEFLVVRTEAGRWLVEEIDLEAITGG